MITVRGMGTLRFRVDDGALTLDVCPCCGYGLETEPAARNVANAIAQGKLTMDDAVALIEAWRKQLGKAP